jgi:hypothetical protein
MVLIASLVLGMVVTGIVLRFRATKAHVQMMALLASGTICWGAQVREMRPGHRWGVSGRLTISEAGDIALKPDVPSVKRGAFEETWCLHGSRITLGQRRRDITGVAFAILTLEARGAEVERRFACFKTVGQLPNPG